MDKIEIEILGKKVEVTKRQLFIAVKKGDVTPETIIYVDGKPYQAGQTKGLPFPKIDERLDLKKNNNSFFARIANNKRFRDFKRKRFSNYKYDLLSTIRGLLFWGVTLFICIFVVIFSIKGYISFLKEGAISKEKENTISFVSIDEEFNSVMQEQRSLLYEIAEKKFLHSYLDYSKSEREEITKEAKKMVEESMATFNARFYKATPEEKLQYLEEEKKRNQRIRNGGRPWP